MIIIIDTKKDICYHTKYKKKAAEFIGVNRSTIHRWIEKGIVAENYNHLKIYLNSKLI